MEILEPTGETQLAVGVYPWKVWLEDDGKPKVIDKEYDFPNIDIKIMQVYVYQQAKALGVKVKTRRVLGRYLVFQVYTDVDNQPVLPAWQPTSAKPKCRNCKRVLSKYSIPFGECRADSKPNTRACKK